MEANKNFDSLVESISQLMEMQDSANDYYSAGLKKPRLPSSSPSATFSGKNCRRVIPTRVLITIVMLCTITYPSAMVRLHKRYAKS